MKTPEGGVTQSGAVVEQLCLLDPPPFSPTFPNRTTLAGRALAVLLKGCALTHPDFQSMTNSWRLSEPIRALRHDFGWPILTIEIPSPTKECPGRTIARYILAPEARRSLEVSHG